MRLFKIAAGVILILTGVFCFANPGATFLSIAFLLGCAMLLSGISGTLAYIWISKKSEITNSLLIEGVTSMILGALVLGNQLASEPEIPVFFGLWVMFTGIIFVVEAYSNLKTAGPELIWLLTIGVISIGVGIYAFFNTILFDFSSILLTGILFLTQGIAVLLTGVGLTLHHRGKIGKTDEHSEYSPQTREKKERGHTKKKQLY